MKLHKISIYNFRNYREQVVELAPTTNLVVGQNGQGKSSLLEAIYFVCTGHSPLTRTDKDLVRWGEASFVLSVEGSIGGEKKQFQSVEWALPANKTVNIEGEKSHKLSDLLGYFSVVIFLPDDIGLVTGSPGGRRRFLDSLLCQFSKPYMENLRSYKRVLAQRNVVLKDTEKYSKDVLEVLTTQLVEFGAAIASERQGFIGNFAPLTSGFFERVSKSDLSLSVQYKNSISEEPQDAPNMAELYRNKLRKMAAAELATKSTLIGPHRDNLLFLLNNRRADEFGSQGQKRLIALSLKLASAQILTDEFSSPPILLLDDVFSDLDEEKRNRLSELMGSASQVIMASPRKKDVPFEVEKTLMIDTGKVLD